MIIWLAITGTLLGLLIGAICTIRINNKVEEDVDAEMARFLSMALVKAVREVSLRRYGVSLNECQESHLPGDCPLCGAE